MKVKLSKAWNQSFTMNSVHSQRTDLDLGDMLKKSEQNQIDAIDKTIQSLEKLIVFFKKKKSKIKEKYKKIRNQIAHDPTFNMAIEDERNRFSVYLNNLGIRKKTLGCSYDQFRILCESQFEDGMKWSNWTNKNIDHAWNLDHIKEKQSGGSNHWSNFVPKNRLENLNKGKLESAINYFLKNS